MCILVLMDKVLLVRDDPVSKDLLTFITLVKFV